VRVRTAISSLPHCTADSRVLLCWHWQYAMSTQYGWPNGMVSAVCTGQYRIKGTKLTIRQSSGNYSPLATQASEHLSSSYPPSLWPSYECRGHMVRAHSFLDQKLGLIEGSWHKNDNLSLRDTMERIARCFHVPHLRLVHAVCMGIQRSLHLGQAC
jgi:hypothetical protein